MKHFFHVLFLLMGSFIGHSQQRFSVYTPKQNIIFIGYSNPLNVLVENYPCDSIVLTTNNGTITHDSCDYHIIPTQWDTAEITISTISGKKIGETELQPMYLPAPTFFIAMASDMSSINVKELAAQEYVRLNYYIGLPIHFDNPPIISFLVTVKRDKKIIFKKMNYTNKIDEDIREFFNTLQRNDTITFSDIYFKAPIDSQTNYITQESVITIQ